MFEISITEIRKPDGAVLPEEKPEFIERLRLTVDTIDILAVAKAVTGVKRKRKAKNQEKV